MSSAVEERDGNAENAQRTRREREAATGARGVLASDSRAVVARRADVAAHCAAISADQVACAGAA